MLNIRIVNDDKDFQALRKDWNYLLIESDADNIFLTWEWLFSWWQSYKENKQLHVLIVEEGESLVGIAPLYIMKKRSLGYRQLLYLEFLGSYSVGSEYLDFICTSLKRNEIMNTLYSYLLKTECVKWDVMNLNAVREDSIAWVYLRQLLHKDKKRYWVTARRQNPFILLPESADKYLASLSRKTRWKFKDYRKKLLSNNEVSIDLAEKKEDVVKYFDIFKDLHQKRWSQKDGKGSFSSERKQYLEFHDKVSKLFWDKGWLSLNLLKVNNEYAAGQYNFIYNGKLYCYSVGYDPEYDRNNVATVLQLIMVENAIAKGLRVFDFLRGTEEYKFYWTKMSCQTSDIAIWKNNLSSNLAFVEEVIKRLIRALYPWNLAKRIRKTIKKNG